MSDSQHTPGPWLSSGAEDRMNYVTAGGQDLAFVLPTDPQTRLDLPVVANARVMAAGPTLLEACRAAVQYLDYLALSNRGTDSDLVARLNDAIALAILPGIGCVDG